MLVAGEWLKMNQKMGGRGAGLVYDMNGGIVMGKKPLEDVYRYIRVVK